MAVAFPFDRPTIDWSSKELGADFKDFEDYVNLLFDGPHCANWTDAQKSSAIVSWSGAKGRQAFSTFTWADPADKQKPDVVLKKFKEYVEPKTNKWLSRFHLHESRQKSNQTTDEFLSECMRQAAKCKLKDNNEIEERVLEQIIVGVKDVHIQQKLLSKGDALTLTDALDIARSIEAAGHQLSQLRASTSETATAHAVRSRNRGSGCLRCGRSHPTRPQTICPAWGSICRGCGKPNHWVQKCLSGQQGGRRGQSDQGQAQSQPKGRPRGQSQTQPQNRPGQTYHGCYEATAYPYQDEHSPPMGYQHDAVYSGAYDDDDHSTIFG